VKFRFSLFNGEVLLKSTLQSWTLYWRRFEFFHHVFVNAEWRLLETHAVVIGNLLLAFFTDLLSSHLLKSKTNQSAPSDIPEGCNLHFSIHLLFHPIIIIIIIIIIIVVIIIIIIIIIWHYNSFCVFAFLARSPQVLLSFTVSCQFFIFSFFKSLV